MTFEPNIPNEWAPLRTVVVGHGISMGPVPTVASAIDPTSKHHIANGTYPSPESVAHQLDGLAECLSSAGVEVLRPVNLEDVEQVFTRDVGLIVDRTLIRSRTIEERSAEWSGIVPLLEDNSWIDLPDGVHLEGGDVIVLDGAILVGVTRRKAWHHLQVVRSLPSALDFLAAEFPDREVIGIELHKDDGDPLASALHLDCAYMPLADGGALICDEAFIEEGQLNSLKNRHSYSIRVSLQEAAELQTNLLHVRPDTLLIDPRFKRLAGALRDKGFHLLEHPMDHVGRMGGLFRCTTMPLSRHH